jgi:tetratricopeptide (TPR) repeat protein
MKRVWLPALLAGMVLFSVCGGARAEDAGNTVSMNVLRAEALYKDGKYADSLAILNKYLAEHPNDVNALVDRGDDHEGLGDQKAAIADYTSALALNPEYAYAYASRCESRREIDLNREALADCSKAIELSPKLAYAYRERALIQLGEDDTAALADADRAVALAPDNAYGFSVRCRIYVALAKYPEAVKDCTTALTADPEQEMAFFSRGRAYIEEQNWNAAIADFGAVLKLNAGETGAYYWLAVARLNGHSYAGALQDVDRYITADRDDPDGYLLRAQIELGLGNKDEARTSATDALRHYRIDNDQAGATRAQALIDGIAGKAVPGTRRR